MKAERWLRRPGDGLAKTMWDRAFSLICRIRQLNNTLYRLQISGGRNNGLDSSAAWHVHNDSAVSVYLRRYFRELSALPHALDGPYKHCRRNPIADEAANRAPYAQALAAAVNKFY